MPGLRDYDVIVPTTGRRWEFLQAAIDSIEGQTVPPAHIIVVVDGSPSTAQRLQERGGLIVLEHAHTRGEAAARQTGIDAAVSTWVSFLDDDDLWASNKQERIFAFTDEHPDCEAVRSGYWMFGSKEGSLGLFGQTPEINGATLSELEAAAAKSRPANNLDYLDIRGRSLELMLERNRGVIGTSMIRRKILNSLAPVPADLAPGADYLLFCHVAAKTEWYLVPERLQFYRLHAGQNSRHAGSASALSMLKAKRIAWAAHWQAAPRPLASYGGDYADELRALCWIVLKQTKDPREALRVYRAGLPLLPQWKHRLLAAIPEPIVWRAPTARRRYDRTAASSGRGPESPTW